jgi:hypothetical protein
VQVRSCTCRAHKLTAFCSVATADCATDAEQTKSAATTSSSQHPLLAEHWCEFLKGLIITSSHRFVFISRASTIFCVDLRMSMISLIFLAVTRSQPGAVIVCGFVTGGKIYLINELELRSSLLFHIRGRNR